MNGDHQMLRDDIKEVRALVEGLHDKLDRKVGRGELFGWLGLTGTAIGFVVGMMVFLGG